MNLPSTRETIILYIIRENPGASGYRIRRIYTESTGKEMSFGTLVPMLRRFEEEGYAVKETNPAPNTLFAYNWHLTTKGIQELNVSLSLLDKMLPRKTIEEGSITPIPYTGQEGNTVG